MSNANDHTSQQASDTRLNCDHCGAELAQGSQFCTQCGTAVDDDPPPERSEHARPTPEQHTASTADRRRNRTGEQTDEQTNNLVISVIAGGSLGFIGALVFAVTTIVMNRFVVLLGLIPAIGAGFGVSLGINEVDSDIGAGLGGFLGLVSMAVGYMLIELSLPLLYTYNWGLLDLGTFVFGFFIAIGWGMNAEEEDEDETQNEEA